MENKFPDINLPVWMNKGEPLTLAHASKTWWERVRDWLMFPLAQIDVDTCDEQLLALLAYQRDVERFPGESLSLFRLRVKYAFVNARDAGCMAGFSRIFERLEIGKIEQLERQLQDEWDVILIRINDEQLSRDNTLMMRLVRQYGRTCRRYFFDVMNENTDYIHPGHFDCVTWFDYYKLTLRPSAIVPELDEVWLLPGEVKTIRVDVLPAGVDDATFTADVDEPGFCSAEVGDGFVTLRGLDFGTAAVTLKTTEGGRTATITARVVAGAKVDFILSSATSPVFYMTASNGVLVDWGDGDIGEHYSTTSIQSGYAPDPDRLTTGETHTLTVYNSETVTFSRQATISHTNRVEKIHHFCGTRSSASYAFYRQSLLSDISPGAFVLPNATDLSYFLSECSNVQALPDDFLTGDTPVTNMEGAFRQTNLASLPAGFLSGARRLSNAYRLFGYCPLSVVEKGLMAACSETLTNLNACFMNCDQLTTDINDIFSAESYPRITNAGLLFYSCVLVTGYGTELMNKMPAITVHNQMFTWCTSLSDYSEIPSGWRMSPAAGQGTGE
ncbi:hypothetical protein DAI21_10615 [Lelliottia sp. WB101]|uniref:phage tail protein n=1 Tax=Lelliottia sp. WB101 TaxID=2153385 RepID=UPI000D204741|nr:phage tail protein [Lelliottia sp. WB101]AVY98081.1 hypothetical protein DAI21_10615 [Lelliottia sp. WB101]